MPPNRGEEIITAQNVDLSNCDREQVQFCGAIQPHGVTLPRFHRHLPKWENAEIGGQHEHEDPTIVYRDF